MFELAVAGAHRAGKGPGLVSEEFTLDQRFGQRRAVDGDERVGCTRAQIVKRARGDLLAGAGAADDQHVGIRSGDGAQLVAQVDHRLGATRQPGLDVVTLSRHGTQQPVLQNEPAAVYRATGHIGQMLGGEGFFHEIVGTLAHCLDRELHVAMPRDEDDRDVGVDLAHAPQQRHAVHAGHADVGDDDAVEGGADEIERALGGGEVTHLQSRKIQRLRRRPSQFVFIVDEENEGCVHSAASRRAGLAAPSSTTKTAPPPEWFETDSDPPKSLTML